ncbi:hypothetical protein XFF6992_560017 [Xanthomonas citri pv. fuscans]|nr:hypothetical protein XFF6992_560017 [Xanthomonas citri pv. fuscans]SOO35574.1 hypothetical protein XFF6994_5460009 [Xanthomonas citri pv. fuscans]
MLWFAPCIRPPPSGSLPPRCHLAATGSAGRCHLAVSTAAAASNAQHGERRRHGGRDPLQATLQPDGRGGHWLAIERALQQAAGVSAGQTVALALALVAEEPARGASGSSGWCPAKRPKRGASASPPHAPCWPRASGVRAVSIAWARTATRWRHPCQKRAEAGGPVRELPPSISQNAYMRHTSAHLYSGAVPPKRF